MSCKQNKKRFLFLTFYGPHKTRVLSFGRFMAESNGFFVVTECKLCGIQKKRHFVTEDELIELGVSIEQIADHRM